MFMVHGEIAIRCAPAQAFAFATEPANIPQWRPDVLVTTTLSEPLAVGATYEEVIAFMGRRAQTFRVVELVPGRQVSVQAVSGLKIRPLQRFTFEPAAEGTAFKYRVEVHTSGPFRLMEPLLPGLISQKWTGYSQRLKRILEGHH